MKKLSDLFLALHENTLDVKSHPGKPLHGSLRSLGGQVPGVLLPESERAFTCSRPLTLSQRLV